MLPGLSVHLAVGAGVEVLLGGLSSFSLPCIWRTSGTLADCVLYDLLATVLQQVVSRCLSPTQSRMRTMVMNVFHHQSQLRPSCNPLVLELQVADVPSSGMTVRYYCLLLLDACHHHNFLQCSSCSCYMGPFSCICVVIQVSQQKCQQKCVPPQQVQEHQQKSCTQPISCE